MNVSRLQDTLLSGTPIEKLPNDLSVGRYSLERKWSNFESRPFTDRTGSTQLYVHRHPCLKGVMGYFVQGVYELNNQTRLQRVTESTPCLATLRVTFKLNRSIDGILRKPRTSTRTTWKFVPTKKLWIYPIAFLRK